MVGQCLIMQCRVIATHPCLVLLTKFDMAEKTRQSDFWFRIHPPPRPPLWSMTVDPWTIPNSNFSTATTLPPPPNLTLRGNLKGSGSRAAGWAEGVAYQEEGGGESEDKGELGRQRSGGGRRWSDRVLPLSRG
jgi:hypothetical protein